MKTILFAALFASVSLATAHAQPARPPVGAEASIPFVNHQGIRDWKPGEDDRIVYIQDAGRNWYRATLYERCLNLPFAVQVGFETKTPGQFDRFSSIVVGDQRCALSNLIASGEPPAQKKH